MSTDLIEPEKLSPEGLRVADVYIRSEGDMDSVAEELGLPIPDIEAMLNRTEVRGYINRIYNEAGFRNRWKMGKVMDEIIAQKLEEMDETDMGSAKDIADLIKQAHDMKMKEMEMELKLLDRRDKQYEREVKNQTNIQNNFTVDATTPESAYNKLLSKLTGGSD